MRLIALIAVLGLVACSPMGNRPQAKASPSPSASATSAAALEAFVPIAERFVEEHRGLKFKSPVNVKFLADVEFQDKLNQANGSDQAGYVTEAKVLHALGLLDGRPDLAKAEQELQGTSVVGFYDPKVKELYVRGVEAKASVRHVLIHELTHALQDQWFSIDRTFSNDDESEIAYRGLVEGDAVRVEDQYIAGLTAAEKRQIQADNAAGGPVPADVPDVLLELDSFVYQAGPPFTRAVVSAEGQQRLDDAFSSPPKSTAELLHPGLFLSRRALVPVDFPTADGTVIDKGVLGEFGLDLILERLQALGEVTSGQAQTISGGWSADRYVAWDRGSQSCVRTRLVMSGQEATAGLLAALRRFAGDHPGTSIEGAGPVLFTACA